MSSMINFYVSIYIDIYRFLILKVVKFDPIDRFGRICRNHFHYYSRSPKEKTLDQIKYILRFSCASRTLARKHKSTVCTFLKRSGLELLEDFLKLEELALSLTFSRASSSLWGVYRSWIYYLNIFCINDSFFDFLSDEEIKKFNILK